MDRVNIRRGRRPIATGMAMKVVIVLLASLWAAPPAAAQVPFDSGSTGVNGAFPPLPAGMTQILGNAPFLIWNMSTGLVRYCSEYDTEHVPETCRTEIATAQIPGIPQGGLTTGVFNFTSVDITLAYPYTPINIFLVGNTNNSPLTILSQNAIHFGSSPFYGTGVLLYANGLNGASTTTGVQPSLSAPGGRPGPGGFAGGAGGATGPPPATGSGGFGPAGGVGGKPEGGSCLPDDNHTFGFGGGASPFGAAPVPLVGGSGGGGGGATTSCGFGRNNGAAGGGGGGAVLMASSTQIRFENPILNLYGGNGGAAACGCFAGGGGSGGALRLVAPTLLSTFTNVSLRGGVGTVGYAELQGAGGTIRIEGDATQFNVFTSDQSTGTVVATPGPVVPPNTPTLRITSIGDVQVSPTPSGNINTPDVMFQTAPANPVTVTLAASNIPLGTSAKIRVTPQAGSFTEVTSSAFSGSPASSTATAPVTIPPGFGAITASATFSCDGTICALLPAKDRANAVVEVVASNGSSRAFIVKGDGTRIDLQAAGF